MGRERAMKCRTKRTNKREIVWEKLEAVEKKISRREMNGEEGEEEPVWRSQSGGGKWKK